MNTSPTDNDPLLTHAISVKIVFIKIPALEHEYTFFKKKKRKESYELYFFNIDEHINSELKIQD